MVNNLNVIKSRKFEFWHSICIILALGLKFDSMRYMLKIGGGELNYVMFFY
jgi:hypothetical protein